MKKGNLAVISTLVVAAAGVVASGAANKKKSMKEINGRDEILKKVHVLYCAFDRWLQIHQEGKTLAEYFEKHNYKTIAIYGMKELGERLLDELKDSGIRVSYAIDRDADRIYAEVDILTPDEELEPVDVIVVTAIYYFDEIEETLSEKVNYPIVSLEDILYSL